jgi:hypothetical protein
LTDVRIYDDSERNLIFLKNIKTEVGYFKMKKKLMANLREKNIKSEKS